MKTLRPAFLRALFPTPRLIPAALAFTLLAGPADVSAQFGGYNPPVERKPKITQQPAALTLEQGKTAVFKVTIDADFPNNTYPSAGYVYPDPTYQWLKNGNRITGATAATLTLTSVQSSDAGDYVVVVSNKLGWVASSPVALTVTITLLPTIMAQPLDVAQPEGATAAFEITVLPSPELSFHWRKNGAFIAGATGSRLVLTNLQPGDAGSYDVLLTNIRGSLLSRAATLTVGSAQGVTEPPLATRIAWHPANAAAKAGENAALTVDAIGNRLTYQWKKNGRMVAGATNATLAFARATTGDMGFYSVTVTGTDAVVESNAAILTVTSGGASRLGNLSTRGLVPANGALTIGFTLRGTGPKQILARAVGPTLTRFGVEGALADPQLQIIPAGATAALLGNDDWCTTTQLPGFLIATTAAGAFALEAGSKDAALLTSLNSATQFNYTARITSSDTTAGGIVLAELYDADSATAPVRLTGISTLAFAGTGANALLPGFTIVGSAPKRLLIRAVGPGLELFGVRNRLANPRLAVIPSGLTQAVAANDGWMGDRALAGAFAAAGAFPLDSGSVDAALVVTLPPGGYTVAVSGAGGATGNALLEIYDLDL